MPVEDILVRERYVLYIPLNRVQGSVLRGRTVTTATFTVAPAKKGDMLLTTIEGVSHIHVFTLRVEVVERNDLEVHWISMDANLDIKGTLNT